MKLSTIFLIIASIQFSIIMFSEGTYVDNTPLTQLIFNPTNWTNAIVLTLFGSLAIGAALAAALVGTLIIGKTDLMVFAVAFSAFIGWTVPIISLWTMIYKEGLFGANEIAVAGLSISGNAFFASLFTAPLIILALFSLINWWRTTGEG